MMAVSELVIFISATVLFFIALKRGLFKTKISHIPGPRQLPILGNLIDVGLMARHKPAYEAFSELQTKYGPVMALQVGVNSLVVTEDFELMKQVLNGDDWTDRMDSAYVKLIKSTSKSVGLLFSTGAHWREARRFTVKTLRNYGFGRQSNMESNMAIEAEDIIKHIDAEILKNGGKVSFKRIFNIPVLNISWSYMSGQRFEWQDPKAEYLLDLNEILLQNNPMSFNVCLAIPVLGHISPKARRCKTYFNEFRKFSKELLNERRKLNHYREEQNDFVDVFLNEMELKTAKDDPLKEFYDDEHFAFIAADIMSAGSETSANTLESAIICVTLHPEAQRKVQEELDKVVGRERTPTYYDLPNLPYTEATLLEIHRITTLIPVNGRQAVRDTTLAGHHIPKGVSTVLNFYAWHMNEKQWPNPRQFRPERFLDENDNVINANKVIAFGQGKRVCIGETVAKATVFTFLTTILQKYELRPVSQNAFQESWLKFHVGFTLSPFPFNAYVTPRK